MNLIARRILSVLEFVMIVMVALALCGFCGRLVFAYYQSQEARIARLEATKDEDQKRQDSQDIKIDALQSALHAHALVTLQRMTTVEEKLKAVGDHQESMMSWLRWLVGGVFAQLGAVFIYLIKQYVENGQWTKKKSIS